MFGLFSQNAMCSHAFLHLPLARGPIAHKRNYKRVLTRGRTLLSLSLSLSLSLLIAPVTERRAAFRFFAFANNKALPLSGARPFVFPSPAI